MEGKNAGYMVAGIMTNMPYYWVLKSQEIFERQESLDIIYAFILPHDSQDQKKVNFTQSWVLQGTSTSEEKQKNKSLDTNLFFKRLTKFRNPSK